MTSVQVCVEQIPVTLRLSVQMTSDSPQYVTATETLCLPVKVLTYS